MGASSSVVRQGAGYRGSNENTVREMQQRFKTNSIPEEVQVAHYTPASFPLLPVINKHTCKLLADSWAKIVLRTEIDSCGNSTSGITAFYNDFYDRIDTMDTSGSFEAVLTRNVDSVNKLQAKGAIIIQIIKFLIAIEEDNEATQYKLYMLGKAHAHKGIRPWQYSIFVQTLLLTISVRLGTGATNDVMAAWVNMLAFVMRSMLPPAIENQVIETEINVNVSSAFASAKVQDELIAVEEALDLRRRIRSNGGSPLHTGTNTPTKHSGR